MNPLDIKGTIAAGATCLALGFCAGFYTETQFNKADQLDEVVEARHDTAVGIDESVKTDERIGSKVATSDERIDAVRQTVAKRIDKQEKKREITFESDRTCGPLRLDVGTVRMLNDARGEPAADAAAQANAESEAPSDVGLGELVDNDLKVVKLYRELAINHDELVDYVTSLVKKQAE